MKKAASFYVVYPSNKNLRNLLNALKLLANENQRTEAHITVRGPYEKKLSKKTIKRFSNIVGEEVLSISKVDNFFDFNQNTVFFDCEQNENLKAVWKKDSYNDFRPHITIYDGEDRDFAEKLYNILSSDFKPFKYRISEISWLEPKSKELLEIVNLKAVPDYDDVFKEVFNISKTEINFSSLSEMKRLQKISMIASRLYENGF